MTSESKSVHLGCISTSLVSTAGPSSSPRLRLSRNRPSAAHHHPHHFSAAPSRLPPLAPRARAHRPQGTNTCVPNLGLCQSIYARPFISDRTRPSVEGKIQRGENNCRASSQTEEDPLTLQARWAAGPRKENSARKGAPSHHRGSLVGPCALFSPNL